MNFNVIYISLINKSHIFGLTTFISQSKNKPRGIVGTRVSLQTQFQSLIKATLNIGNLKDPNPIITSGKPIGWTCRSSRQAAQSPSSVLWSRESWIGGIGSPDGAVHHEVHRGASWELADGALLHGRVNLDLPHVRVSAVLVVGEHGDLDHEGTDWFVCSLKNTEIKNYTLKKKIE